VVNLAGSRRRTSNLRFDRPWRGSSRSRIKATCAFKLKLPCNKGSFKLLS
jgi:hypothetical protein